MVKTILSHHRCILGERVLDFCQPVDYSRHKIMSVITAPKTNRPKRKVRRSVDSGLAGMVVQFAPAMRMNGEQLLRFCADHRDLRIEQTAQGALIIMPPAGYESGRLNFRIYLPFAIWQEKIGGGECADSSAGFTLRNGAVRSPDVSWVRQEKLDQLTPEQRKKFPPLCPDFVFELLSDTDRLTVLKKKMAEYLDNGARLGWLIDPVERQVFVYRPGQPVERLKAPVTLSGEPVLAGFTLDLARVW